MGCVPSINDEKSPAPTVFPQTRLTTDYFWFLLFCCTTIVTVGIRSSQSPLHLVKNPVSQVCCVIACSFKADLDNIYTMEDFWDIDILLVVDEGRYYMKVILLCLAWATGWFQ